jgi:hypothetical protein
MVAFQSLLHPDCEISGRSGADRLKLQEKECVISEVAFLMKDLDVVTPCPARYRPYPWPERVLFLLGWCQRLTS